MGTVTTLPRGREFTRADLDASMTRRRAGARERVAGA